MSVDIFREKGLNTRKKKLTIVGMNDILFNVGALSACLPNRFALKGLSSSAALRRRVQDRRCNENVRDFRNWRKAVQCKKRETS